MQHLRHGQIPVGEDQSVHEVGRARARGFAHLAGLPTVERSAQYCGRSTSCCSTPMQQKQRSDESQKRESSSSASGPARSASDSIVAGPGHQLAEGVRLSQVFSTIRGMQGERTRNGRTTFDEKYAGRTPAQVIERITAVQISPHRILETGNTTAFDPCLPLS